MFWSRARAPACARETQGFPSSQKERRAILSKVLNPENRKTQPVISMNTRIVLLDLTSIFLLLALVMAASAQTRTVGVSVFNKFRYIATASWSSNDPTATPSSSLLDFNNTQWLEFTITAISGTNVTGQMTTHYKNGTENTTGGWVDVNTGAGENMTAFVISANLVPGDTVYNSSQSNAPLINETVPRTYLGGVRETNHLNITSLSGTESFRTDYYWDKSTGVTVELAHGETNQTGGYTTSWSSTAQIINSDLWEVPEFPSWITALLMLILLTSVTMIIARRMRNASPSQTETPRYS